MMDQQGGFPKGRNEISVDCSDYCQISSYLFFYFASVKIAQCRNNVIVSAFYEIIVLKIK